MKYLAHDGIRKGRAIAGAVIDITAISAEFEFS